MADHHMSIADRLKCARAHAERCAIVRQDREMPEAAAPERAAAELAAAPPLQIAVSAPAPVREAVPPSKTGQKRKARESSI